MKFKSLNVSLDLLMLSIWDDLQRVLQPNGDIKWPLAQGNIYSTQMWSTGSRGTEGSTPQQQAVPPRCRAYAAPRQPATRGHRESTQHSCAGINSTKHPPPHPQIVTALRIRKTQFPSIKRCLVLQKAGCFWDTHVKAWHVDPVAYNHVNELVRGTILSEKDLSIEDFWGQYCQGPNPACLNTAVSQ